MSPGRPSENFDAFLVTFSGERLRNEVKGRTLHQTKTKDRERKNMKTQNTVQETVMESKSRRGFEYVKRVALSAPGKFLLVVAVIISVVSVPLLTRADGRNEQDRNGHDRHQQKTLTGNWLVTVTPTPPSQAAPFHTLMTYFDDGNLLQESSSSTLRSTGRGNWERTGHRQFTQSIIFFRFDSARTYLGTRVITSTITLSEDGSQYQADSVGQNFDTSGNLLTTSQATEVAQRLF